jgi:hypothetical protein
MTYALRMALLASLMLPVGAVAQSRRWSDLKFVSAFAARPPLQLGHRFGAPTDSVVGRFESVFASPAPEQTCPMPISSSDPAATRSMPVAKSDTTLTVRMPTARLACRNPLLGSPKKP